MTTGDLDIAQVLRGLDAIFAEHRGAEEAEPYLRDALDRARQLRDRGAVLTLLNELVGFYRSVSRHAEAITCSEEALDLVANMGLAATDVGATTLINAATAYRAAGEPARAEELYRRALETSDKTMAATDPRRAALHNNLSMLYSDTGRPERARAELEAALAILRAAGSERPGLDRDLELATTCTNLALVCLTLGEVSQAADYAAQSLTLFRESTQPDNPHVAAALAGQAQVSDRLGRYADAVELYRRALAVIEQCYGTGSDAYAVTSENLAQAERAAATAQQPTPAVGAPAQQPTPAVGAPTQQPTPTTERTTEPTTAATTEPAPPPTPAPLPTAAPTGKVRPAVGHPAQRSGLELAREAWQTYGLALIAERYPRYQGRIAAGLVGHGSDRYGFDNAISRDHDAAPGFCLWLTAADYAEIGAALQADYDALPLEQLGGPAAPTSPRASGTGRRLGVFEIGDFFQSITGYRAAPPADHPHEWLLLEEATLAAATNGAVFADPLGAFGSVRSGFRRMPRDVRLALISRRLGMVSQAGQYNVPRMLERGDGAAAWLAVGEFVRATASLVFLLNGPAAVGYLPYYKWQFAALRRLSARMGSRLPGVADDLAEVLRLAGPACFGAGEGSFGGATGQRTGDGAAPVASTARRELEGRIAQIAAAVVAELQAQGLTGSAETFLEWQRPHIAAHITNEWLRNQ